MKLQQKLMIAPIIILAMQALSFAVLLWVFNSYKTQNLDAHQKQQQSFDAIANVRLLLAQQHAGLYRTVAISSSLDEKAIKALNVQRGAQLATFAANINKEAGALKNPAAQQTATRFADQMALYGKAADEAIDLSTMDANTGIAAMQTADAKFSDMDKTLVSIIELTQKSAANELLQFESATATHRLWVGLLALLLGLGSIYFAWLMQRNIVLDLNTAAQATRDVASGQLDIQLDSHRADELGDMLRSLGSMVKHLHSTIELVQQTADVIVTGSKDIATDNKELKLRSGNQVIALEETVNAMRKITGTVTQNADSAAEANQLAESASSVAVRGGVAVSQVVTTMGAINASANKIVDIISVIDGIAFQTNLLALNAAVEAARAGPQGKGFAVVAAEVRGLAQRSAAAAKEIKTLIADSVEKVGAGTVLADQAGATMEEIVASVNNVTQILGKIAAASQEQRSEIEQVNSSVQQMEDATQKSSVLVDKTASAAISLQNRAKYLAHSIGAFKLDQRAAQRVPLVCPGRIRLANGASLDVQTIDLSITGVGVELQQALPKGQHCEVEFEVPFGTRPQRVVAKAQVAYSAATELGNYKAGLEFLGAPSMLNEVLTQLMQ